jgi:hypothetical protein
MTGLRDKTAEVYHAHSTERTAISRARDLTRRLINDCRRRRFRCPPLGGLRRFDHREAGEQKVDQRTVTRRRFAVLSTRAAIGSPPGSFAASADVERRHVLAKGERGPTRKVAECARPYPAYPKKSKGTAGCGRALPAPFRRGPLTVSVTGACPVFYRDYSGLPAITRPSGHGVPASFGDACRSPTASDQHHSACKICAIRVGLIANG